MFAIGIDKIDFGQFDLIFSKFIFVGVELHVMDGAVLIVDLFLWGDCGAADDEDVLLVEQLVFVILDFGGGGAVLG